MSGIHSLDEIYSADSLELQAKRYKKAEAEFLNLFGNGEVRFFSAPGRTEVGGNHTDHNQGRVLAAGVSLDVIAAVRKTDDSIIEIKSEGFPKDTVDISDLTPKENEKNTSAALIRGVCKGFADRGYKIGGFRAYTTSNVLKGSGLSSSAAFEVLVGSVLRGLYGSDVSDVEVAQIAQFAENEFFGKPSGLMDQMASSVGGFITIDFADPKEPVIEKIDFDFEKSGHSLCIVDTKGNHADLTPEYAAIPAEMKAIASFFGRDYLRGIRKEIILENVKPLRERFGDRAVLRALHFCDDNERVLREAEALKNGSFRAFLDEINASGDSSYKYLQNIYAGSAPNEQGLAMGLYIAENALDGEGACRVHGGGFAGTIQAFVPNYKLQKFIDAQTIAFGEGACHVLSIRPFGGTETIINS